MTDTGKRFYGPAQPGTSIGDLFTVTSAHSYHVNCIVCANTTAAEANVTISIESASDTAAARLLDQVPVPARGTLVLPLYVFMAAGEVMRGKQGTASAITVTISGVDET